MKLPLTSLFCGVFAMLLTACSSGLNAPINTNSATSTVAPSPLPNEAYKAAITPVQPLPAFKAGESASITVKVKNAGTGTWPALGQGPKYKVDLGNHWFDAKGVELAGDDGRCPLPHDLKAGEEAELLLRVKAPKTPGDYVLVLDMVHEDITWFALRGSPTVKLNVTVQ